MFTIRPAAAIAAKKQFASTGKRIAKNLKDAFNILQAARERGNTADELGEMTVHW